VIWTLAPLLLFTASIGKQPRYILPVLPPLAMMLGLAIADRVAAARAWTRLPIVMALSAAALLLTLQFGAFAGRRPEAAEEIAAMIRVNRHGGEPVGEYQAFVRNLVFYTRFDTLQVFNDAGALAFLKSSERVFLVVHQTDLARLQTMTNIPLNTIGAVTYLNTASVRLRTLLAPLPEQDLETVVLVSNR